MLCKIATNTNFTHNKENILTTLKQSHFSWHAFDLFKYIIKQFSLKNQFLMTSGLDRERGGYVLPPIKMAMNLKISSIKHEWLIQRAWFCPFFNATENVTDTQIISKICVSY